MRDEAADFSRGAVPSESGKPATRYRKITSTGPVASIFAYPTLILEVADSLDITVEPRGGSVKSTADAVICEPFARTSARANGAPVSECRVRWQVTVLSEVLTTVRLVL